MLLYSDLINMQSWFVTWSKKNFIFSRYQCTCTFSEHSPWAQGECSL